MGKKHIRILVPVIISSMIVLSLATLALVYKKQHVQSTALREENQKLIRTLSQLQTNMQRSQELKLQTGSYNDIAILRDEIIFLRVQVDYMISLLVEETGKDEILFYLEKLKEKQFTSTYGEGVTLYIAAEKLGRLGRRSIPFLMQKLDGANDYERMQVLYALFLASQHYSMSHKAQNEIPRIARYYALPSKEWHPELITAWKAWWKKYRVK